MSKTGLSVASMSEPCLSSSARPNVKRPVRWGSRAAGQHQSARGHCGEWGTVPQFFGNSYLNKPNLSLVANSQDHHGVGFQVITGQITAVAKGDNPLAERLR